MRSHLEETDAGIGGPTGAAETAHEEGMGDGGQEAESEEDGGGEGIGSGHAQQKESEEGEGVGDGGGGEAEEASEGIGDGGEGGAAGVTESEGIGDGGGEAKAAKPAAGKGKLLGKFQITHYTLALESDARFLNSPKIQAPGLPAGAKYRDKFLGISSRMGVKMQGTGKGDDGKFIHYAGNNKFEYTDGPRGASARIVQPWQSIAVDRGVIKMGSHVSIDAYPDKVFRADDTGGAIKGNHIDVYIGPAPLSTAYSLGTKSSNVYLADGAGGGAQTGGGQTAPGGQGATGGASGGTPPAKVWKPAPSEQDVAAGRASLKLGDQGAAVQKAQSLLGKGVAPDGKYGDGTERAVRSFQKEHSLSVDGKIGKNTWRALTQKGADPAGQKQPDAGGDDHSTGAGKEPGESEDKSPVVSGQAAKQMAALLGVATNSNKPGGMCYKAVKHYIQRAGGYGNIKNIYSDARFSSSQLYARMFADLMNSQGAAKFGLQKLGCSTPFEAPAGAIVVVAPRSPGTGHPKAGDITVAGGNGLFYNDGVMRYHGPKAWPPKAGGLLGVYAPI